MFVCDDTVRVSGLVRPSRSSLGRASGRAVGSAWSCAVLTVEADAQSVEVRLRAGLVACPACLGILSPWGFARPRVLRAAGGARLRLRPRRGCCTGCGRTHVLLPLVGLARRADTAAVIGAGLEARARGLGQRRIAALLGRAPSTVRGWLRRFAGRV